MSRVETIKAVYIDAIPASLENGVIYISQKYRTASHLCACGCGNKVVTPLKPGGWELRQKGEQMSLYPSIGNWSFPCQSHYWIDGNKIVWARKWNKEQIRAVRRSDELARRNFFDAPRPESFFRRFLNCFLGRS
jgi:hypothetical protein